MKKLGLVRPKLTGPQALLMVNTFEFTTTTRLQGASLNIPLDVLLFYPHLYSTFCDFHEAISNNYHVLKFSYIFGNVSLYLETKGEVVRNYFSIPIYGRFSKTS